MKPGRILLRAGKCSMDILFLLLVPAYRLRLETLLKAAPLFLKPVVATGSSFSLRFPYLGFLGQPEHYTPHRKVNAKNLMIIV